MLTPTLATTIGKVPVDGFSESPISWRRTGLTSSKICPNLNSRPVAFTVSVPQLTTRFFFVLCECSPMNLFPANERLTSFILTTNLFETSPLYSSAFSPPAGIPLFGHHHPVSRQPASLGSASHLTLRFPHPVATPCAVPRKRLPTFMPRLVLRRPPFPLCASNFPLIYVGGCAPSPQRCKTTALKP